MNQNSLSIALKSLKDELDVIAYLEIKNVNDPIALGNLSIEKSNLVRKVVSILSSNEWEKDRVAGISISPDTIDRAKSLIMTLDKIQELSTKTNNPVLKQGLKKDYAITLSDIVSILTVWFEFGENTMLQSVVQQEALKKTSQPLTQETSKEVVKEASEHKNKKALTSILEKPTETEIQNLTSVVDDTPTKAPILAKELSIADRGQIVMHNNIYKVNLGTLSELESNLFFSLFNRLKDKKDTIIRFTPKELKILAGDADMPNARLYKLIINLFNNIAGANFDLIKMVDDEKVQRSKVMFFRKFEVQYDKNKNIEYLDIQVNDPYFTYLLNDLKANFTSMKLQTFVDLSGKYAKNFFRLLERFKRATDKNGVFHVHMYENNIEGFFAFMGIPKGTRISDIDIHMLNPTIKQLTQKKPMSPYEPPYKSIKVIKNKAKARGQKVLGYTFEVIPNPIIVELEKALENAKTPPLKRFSKRDINTLNKCLDMRGKLSVRDKEGKAYTFSDAMITDIYPCPTTKRICVQFRINGFLDPEMMGVIDLYQDNRHLFQVCGNEYLSLVFESIDELKNKFLKTAYKSGGANATQTTTQADTPTAHTHTQNTPTSANQDAEIFVLQSPMPTRGGELVTDCKNGRVYVFKKVQLIAKIQDAEQDILSLFKILEPTDTDLEIAKRHHREKKDINFFKKVIPDCDAPHYFTYTFKKKNEIDAWRLKNLF